ncbi:MAG: sigma-70 family RNA polymerase sigma factor [Actinocatenispora sp.]
MSLPADHPDRPRLRDQVIRAFLPMAYRQVRRYRYSGQDLRDLNQVAALALVKAVDHYDPTLGYAFSSYAIPCIQGELKRHFRDKAWLIQPPRPIQELRTQTIDARQRLTQTLRRAPTPGELADELGVDVERILEVAACDRCFQPISLNAPRPGAGRAHDGDTDLADQVGDTDHELDIAADRASLPAALAYLSERDRAVIVLRFYGDLTQTEIGERLGISQMHVSRLLKGAVEQMRAFLNGDPPPATTHERKPGPRARRAGHAPAVREAA